MTDEQRTLANSLFDGWGRQEDRDITLRGYVVRAETIDDPARIPRLDGSAERLIQECRELEAKLTAYRVSLAERYAHLTTAPTVPVVRLTRQPNSYTGKVFYYLETFRRYVGTGKEVPEASKKYPGAERRQALADYTAYCKSHPGITAEMDIARRSWER